jgi:hypothetical protein
MIWVNAPAVIARVANHWSKVVPYFQKERQTVGWPRKTVIVGNPITVWVASAPPLPAEGSWLKPRPASSYFNTIVEILYYHTQAAAGTDLRKKIKLTISIIRNARTLKLPRAAFLQV